EIPVVEAVQPEQGDEQGGRGEQSVAEVVAEYVPLPYRLTDIPIGDSHRHDARVRPEQNEEVLPQRVLAEKNKGGDDDEKRAQIVRRTQTDVEINSPILRV